MRSLILCTLFVMAIPPVAHCAEGFRSHGYYLRAAVGSAHHDVGKVNDLISKIEQWEGERLNRLSGTALMISGGLGMFVSRNLSVGIRLNYQNNDEEFMQRITVAGTDVSFLREETFDTDVLEGLITASVWIPRQSGLMLGAGCGISRVSVDIQLSDGGNRRVGAWSASDLVFELFSGAQITLRNELMVFLRFGYASRDFGTVQETVYRGSDAPVFGLDADFSGWFVEIGFGGHTRRAWSPPR
ncbi:MAG: hypothetical protein JSW58_07680 [Candidatus Latescibacterota bacterium]|nr:MAG: hypothetical protein JSW58_07680 [Candidatus Latescibacterota bacterium]